MPFTTGFWYGTIPTSSARDENEGRGGSEVAVVSCIAGIPDACCRSGAGLEVMTFASVRKSIYKVGSYYSAESEAGLFNTTSRASVRLRGTFYDCRVNNDYTKQNKICKTCIDVLDSTCYRIIYCKARVTVMMK